MEQNINNPNNFKFLPYFFIYIFLPQIISYLLNRDLRGGFNPYLKGFISGLKLHSSPTRTGKKYNLHDNSIDYNSNQIKNLDWHIKLIFKVKWLLKLNFKDLNS